MNETKFFERIDGKGARRLWRIRQDGQIDSHNRAWGLWEPDVPGIDLRDVSAFRPITADSAIFLKGLAL